jgi:hypothetical protein
VLPPLEESKIIDKKEMREQVRDMIIQDNDSDDEASILKQDEDNRRRIMQDSQQYGQDDSEIGDPADYYSEEEDD